jgi:hypothetical protein
MDADAPAADTGSAPPEKGVDAGAPTPSSAADTAADINRFRAGWSAPFRW